MAETSLKQAEDRLFKEVHKDVKESGWIEEGNPHVFIASNEVIKAMAAQIGGDPWLGIVNLGDNIHRGEVMWQAASCCAFEASFVAPRYDEELVRLIRERDEAPYEGTAKDGERVDAIFERLKVIGGTHLFWG